MTEGIEAALARTAALLALEDTLLERARNLYRQGFRPPVAGRAGVSAAQMAAVDERIQTAPDSAQACRRVQLFLAKQRDKLLARKERTGRAESWLLPRADGKADLGATLVEWIDKKSYLPDNVPREADELDLLRRFWSYFYGLYRYDRICGTGMVFAEDVEESD